MCRSPMLEVFLAAEVRARGADARVHSSGTLADGRPAVPEVVDAAADLGFDLRGHASRRLTADQVRDADLVLPLARQHLREIVVDVPEAFARTYTPKELVRRAAAAGGRGPDEPLDQFLVRLHQGRRSQDLVRDDPVDDVADPIGGPRSGYERTAAELRRLAADIAVLLVPAHAAARPAPPSSLSPTQES
jgi:protein-tyrosine-phosphatase